MNEGLPESLRWAHNLIADVAPLGSHGDDLDRLQGTSASLDIATEAKSGRSGTNDAAAHVRTAGNVSDDLTAFEDLLPVAQAETDKGGVAAAVSGTATMLLVTLKMVWRLYVIAALIALVIALVRYFALGPALGTAGSRLYIAALRQRMQVALAGMKDNIRRNPVAALRHAKALLRATARMGDLGAVGYVTGLATVPALVAAGFAVPWDDNEEARDLTERTLRETEEGRAALAYARDHGITTIYRNELSGAETSRYHPESKLLILDAHDFGRWNDSDDLAEDFIRHIEVARGDDGRFGDGSGRADTRTEDEREQDAAWYRLHYERPTSGGQGVDPDKITWPYARINELFDLR
ncbi:hypothetical protein ACGF0J_34645 [Nonomuraea sp. NPDC047897]|uniref:hypothetical protein n=1 Tax=Nonomuraea sp. NPDC047897 TaxID=3364346 RepID=UPI0037100416